MGLGPPRVTRTPLDTYPTELTPDSGFRSGGRCPKSSRVHPAWAATALVVSRVTGVVLEWVLLFSGGFSLAFSTAAPKLHTTNHSNTSGKLKFYFSWLIVYTSSNWISRGSSSV